jgi:hypothetical protein
MRGINHSVGRPRAERGHPLVFGSTLMLTALTALAMKATAGMRGQTVRELVRGQTV